MSISTVWKASAESARTSACFSVEKGYFSAMSKIEEIERAVEQLPLDDFVKLAGWVDQRRQQLELFPSATDKRQGAVRDQSAFLNSYAPQDEGLHDDAAGSRGERARKLMGAGRRWLKPGADPVGDLIREREQDDKLDQADERQ
jgi:hypothetical protein